MTFSDALDQFLKPYVGEVFPACAIAIYRRGELVADGAWGWIDPEAQQISATTETRFDFASLTKLFTATALLSQIGEGLADLHTPLIDILPEFSAISPRGVNGGQDPHSKAALPTPPESAGEAADPAGVTLFHLLTHTSGLPPWRDVYNVAPPPLPPGQHDPFPRGLRWGRALKALCEYPFVGQPGEAVRYSDIGLMLLGEVVSRLQGTAGDLVPAITARVFVPMGLHNTGFLPVQAGVKLEQIAPTEDDPTWRKRRVWGEVHDENACGVGGVAGHAGLFGTARDVADFGLRWLSGTARDVPGVPSTLIQAAKQEQAVTGNERRGLGWMIRSRRGSSAGDQMSEATFGHTGFVGNSLWIDPEAELAVACLTNHVYYGREKDGIYEFRRALHDWVKDRTEDFVQRT